MDEPIVTPAVVAPAAPVVAAAVEPAVVVVAPAPAEPVVAEKPEGIAPSEPFTLAVPDFVALAERTPERESYVAEFQKVAPSVGLDAGAAQGLLGLAVDAATTIDYQAADEYTTTDDAFDTMVRTFGESEGTNLVNQAQRFVAKHPGLSDYLDRTGLGNDLGVMVALALAESGLLNLSPTKAQAEIDRLMHSAEYKRGDKVTMVKLQALARVAHGDGRNTDMSIEAKTFQANEKKLADVAVAGKATAKKEAEAMIADTKGDLMNSGAPGHAAALKAYHALIARM